MHWRLVFWFSRLFVILLLLLGGCSDFFGNLLNWRLLDDLFLFLDLLIYHFYRRHFNISLFDDGLGSLLRNFLSVNWDLLLVFDFLLLWLGLLIGSRLFLFGSDLCLRLVGLALLLFGG